MSRKSTLGLTVLLIAISFSSITPADTKPLNLLEEIEIVATGSRLSRMARNSSASIRSVGKSEIFRNGILQPADLLPRLPTISGAHIGADGINEISFAGVNSSNLFGLGESSTLTLINGHRQTVSSVSTRNGNQTTDLNSLVPLIAVERVEVLKSGASSIYGADAVAGAKNFITYENFSGDEISLSFQSSGHGQEDVTFSGMTGRRIDNVSYLLAASYFDRTPLSAADVRDEYPLRDANSIFGQPGTYLIGGVPTPDPSCAQVAQSHPDTTASPGAVGFCSFDFGDFFRLVNEEQRSKLYADLRVDLDNDGEIFFESHYANNEVISTTSPTQPILFPQVVPLSNPGNFANVPMLHFGRIAGSGQSASEIMVESITYRLNGGLELPLTDGWQINARLSYSANDYDYSDTSDTAVDRYIDALNGRGGDNGDLFYNPLYGADNSQEVLDYIQGEYGYAAESSLAMFDIYVTGMPMTLPAGDVDVVFGAQFQRNQLSYAYSPDAKDDNLFFFIGNRDFSTNKDISAAFIEVYIPVLKTVDIDVALRYEDHGEFDTTDPKLGAVWRINDTTRLFGDISTSFRTPSLFQDAGQITAPARVFDPTIDRLVTVSQRTVSDPVSSLQPEQSTNFNVGVGWSSSNDTTLVELRYFNFDYKDIITAENATAVVASSPFGDRVIRDASTNALLAVTTFYRNAGGLQTDGLDLTLSYQLSDSVSIQTKTIRTLGYDLDDPVLGKVDGLGMRNFTNFASPMPKLRSNAGLYWQGNGQAANLIVRHIGSYNDDNNPGAGNISSHTTLDAQLSIELPSFFANEEVFTLALGAKNITDEYAPSIVSRNGFDTRTYTGLGRQVYGSIHVEF